MTIRNLIYIKKCLGQEGKPIDIYKIRTMCVGAEGQLDEIVDNDIDSFGKIMQDSRITPFGRFLRKYWIDELPQLYNLGKGDIKLVGVRPMTENAWQRYPPEIMEKTLRQKPGLMGIDYAFSHSDSFNDKLEHMDKYLNQWERNSSKTDREYVSRIFSNIVFGRIRSS